MTNLSNIENIISSFKQGRDYVTTSEGDGRTRKLIYSILTDELKREISPFTQFDNSSIQGLKTEEGNRHDGYFSYEAGNNGEPDKFTVISGLEANKKEAEALRRPKEIAQRMQEIERRQKQIAQQMRNVEESDGSEIINTTSYTERRRGDGGIVFQSNSSSTQPEPERTRRINDNERGKQEQCPQVVQPFPPHKK